ncbi:MAG: isoprenylcysteine carboxylmethyltransferase family protein [Steroidobacteraceae bacterium]
MAVQTDGSRRRGLELRLPPPLVALLLAGVMWQLAKLTPQMELSGSLRHVVSGVLFLTGVLFALSAMLAFRRSKTTVNPLRPEAATALVSGGPFRVSRNPMYLGLLLALIGWAVMLGAPWGLAGPVAFVLYIQRFQIIPEERVMALKFGEVYAQYCVRVRRWL